MGAMANEDFTNAKTSVWWDIENCPLPNGVDPHAVAQNISSALSKSDYRGPISISAFGDTHNLPANIQRALSSTGIALNHVPAGVKDASDKKILVDMLFWAVDNSAPANYLLISGDRDFANALHRLSMRRYNILLAHPTLNVSPSLSGAAKNIWLWTSLAMGEQGMSTIKDIKQLDRTSDSNSLTNGASKGSIGKRSSLSKQNLQDSLSQGFASSGLHYNNGGSLSDFDKVRGQIYAKNSGIEQSISNAESANGEIYSSKTFFPEISLLTSTTSRAQNLAAGCETRVSLLSDSDGFGKTKDVNPSQSSQGYANSRLDSGNDLKPNVSGTRTTSNSSVKFSSVNTQSSSVPGANAVQAKVKARRHPKMKPSCPPKERPSCPQVMPNYPSQVRHIFPPQVTPNSHTENHFRARPNFPAEFRADMPAIEKLNISSDSQQSLNTQSGLCSVHQFSQLLPSEKIPTYLGNMTPSNIAQLETSVDAVPLPPPKLPPPQYPGSDVSHRVRMRILLRAMETLKQNMMAPTEQNLEDCIKYGEMRIPTFNIQENMAEAVERKDLVIMTTGGGFKVFLPCDTVLWQCVDPLSTYDRYPKEVWDEFFKFLSSHEGSEAITLSQSRYDAAQLLKKSCLKTLLLGQIIHMLYLAIEVKRWLRRHHLGWSPLSVTIPEIWIHKTRNL